MIPFLITNWRLMAYGAATALVFYAGYHTCYVIHEARINSSIEVLPAKIIHDTQIITKTLKASHDPCVNTAAPSDVLKLVR